MKNKEKYKKVEFLIRGIGGLIALFVHFTQKLKAQSPKQISNSKYQSASNKLATIFFAALVIIMSSVLLPIHSPLPTNNSYEVHAATGINETLNFHGRLRDAGGGVVADGYYHMRFKIYQGGDGNLGGGDETQQWTESYSGASTSARVRVENGYFNVPLGSNTAFGTSVDWNDDTLWLSMEVGGSTSSANWDGEMDPFKRLTAVPYAFNSKELGGRTSGQFVQLDPGASAQNINTTNSAINVNQQGTGNILNLQDGGVDVFTIQDGGNVGIGTTTPDELLHVSAGTSGNGVIRLESDTDNNNESDNPILRLLQDGATTDGLLGFAGNADIDPVDGSTATGVSANSLLIGTRSNDDFQILTNGSPRLTVSNTGEVGIGTTSPSARLSVRDTDTSKVQLDLQVNAGQTADAFQALDSSGTKRTWINEKGELRTRAAADNSVAFRIKDNSSTQTGHLLQIAGFTPAEALSFFDGRGRLGIGYDPGSNTTDADAALTVDAYADGEVAAIIRGNSATQSGDLLRVQRADGDSYDVLNVNSNGDFKVQGISNSTTAFEVVRQNGLSLLNFDTSNQYATLKRGNSTITGQPDSSVLFGALNNSGSLTNSSIHIESGDSAQSRIYFGDNLDQDIGQLIYDNSDDSFRFLTNTSEQLRIDSSGNVGIGNSNPGSELEVGSSTSPNQIITVRSQNSSRLYLFADQDNVTESDNPAIVFQQDGSTVKGFAGFTGVAGSNPIGGTYTNSLENAFLWGTESPVPLQLGTSDTARLTIESGGNVGIGSTAPNELLTVDGRLSLQETTAPSATTGYGKLYASSSDSKIYFVDSSGTSYDLTAGSGGTVAGSDGQIQYNNGGSFGGTSNFYWDDVNSRLGLGTSSPSELLHVSAGTNGKGVVRIEADTDNSNESDTVYIELLQDGGAVTGILGHSGGNDLSPDGSTFTGVLNNSLVVGTTSSQDLQFGTNNNIGLTLDTGGRVGIGDTTPDAQLDLGGTVTNTANAIRVDSTIQPATTNALGMVFIPTLSPDDTYVASGMYLDPTINLETGATIPSFRGVEIGTPETTGTGSLTNSYQLFLHEAGTSATNTYGIYAAGSSSDHYLAGNLAVGSTTFDAKLKVDTDPGTNQTALLVSQDDTTNNNVAVDIQNTGTGNSLQVNTDELVVDGSGNVGINTSSPVSQLDVQGDVNIKYGNVLRVGQELISDGTWGNASAISKVLEAGYFDSQDTVNMYVPGNPGSTRPAALTLKGNGNVGVGTGTPNEQLTVNGRLSLQETTSPSNTTGYGKLFVKSSDSKLYFRDDGGTEFDLTAVGTCSTCANTTLSNLGTTAINTSLLPDTDDTYDLGSSTARWQDLYLGPNSLNIGTDSNNTTVSYNTSSSQLQLGADTQVQGDIAVNGEALFNPTNSTQNALAVKNTSGKDVLKVDTLTLKDIVQTSTISNTDLDEAQDVTIVDNYAYVVSGTADSLTIINITNPASQAQIGTISNSNLNGAKGVDVSGDYAYVASGSADSLTIIDISDPATPTQAGTISNTDLNGATDVVVSGNYAYVASNIADALTIIDVSDPATPTQAGTISNTDLNGAQGVDVSGNYAYIASNVADSLTIIDISTPSSPTQAGTISNTDLNGAQGVDVSGNYAYVASDFADALTIIDISNPSSPTQTSTISSFNLNGASGVTIDGNYAYLTAKNYNSLTVIDVSTPSSPTQIASISNANLEAAQGIAVSGNYAYVASGGADSLTIIDISSINDDYGRGKVTVDGQLSVNGSLNQSIFSQTGVISNTNFNGAKRVETAGNYAYVIASSSLRIVDISDPVSPTHVGSSGIFAASDVAVAGNYAYVTSNVSDSLTIIDVSDPSSPTQTGSISNADLENAQGVDVSGNYAYVASGVADSLTIIDVSNPSSPTQTGTISNANLDFANHVAVSGSYAYVASGSADSLTIIDVSNPASPTQTGTISNANLNNAQNVAVSGNYAYVASNVADSLTIIDVSNPSSPTQTGTISNIDLEGATDVAIIGNYVYIASSTATSLTVINVSNPASPIQVGTISNSNLYGAQGVAVSGNYAYVASSTADSLTVIEVGISNQSNLNKLQVATDASIFGQLNTSVINSDTDLIFKTNNSEVVRILNNGNVGIGTNNPDHKLDIRETAASADAALQLVSDSGDSEIRLIESGGAGWFINYDGNNSNQLNFYSCGAGGCTGNNRFNLDRNQGRVAIGTSSTASGARLHVDTDDGDNHIGLQVNQDDITNNPTAVSIQNTGTGNSLQVNTSDFVINGDGKVGIGAVTPDTDLEILQASDSINNGLRVTASGGSEFGNIWRAAYGLHISNDGSANSDSHITIFDDGGIEVNGAGTSSSGAFVINGTGFHSPNLYLNQDSLENFSGANLIFQYDGAETGRIGADDQYLYLTGADVGIGTQTPSTKLHVYEASNGANATIQTAGTGVDANFQLETLNGGWMFKVDESDTRKLRIGTSSGVGTFGTDILTMQQNGNVGINDTTPDAQLDVHTASASTEGIQLIGSSSQTAALMRVFDSVGGSELFNVQANGNVGIGTASPDDTLDVNGNIIGTNIYFNNASAGGNTLCWSDSGVHTTHDYIRPCGSLRSLKKNIQTLNVGGLNTINKLKPRQYNWKEDGRADLGFVAEEVESVNPIFAVYSDGKLQSVNYRHMMALAIQGIQELDDKTDNIQSQVDDLKVNSLQNGDSASFSSLNVSGATTLNGELTVKGNSTFEKDLLVNGKLTVNEVVIKNDIHVNGHIASKGAQPEIAPGEGLGANEEDPTGTIPEDQLNKVAVEIDGTDTAGTIRLESGVSALNGLLADVSFSKVYESSPRIVLSARNEMAAKIRIYVEPKADGSGFEIYTLDAPADGEVHEFDYVVIGSDSTEVSDAQ